MYAVIAFAYLLLPVAYTFVFSFNDAGKSNLVWRGFTFDNWLNPCGAPEVCGSLVNSIAIGFIATAIATALGTLIALALVRYRFKGRASTNLLIFLPMATPEVVLGSSMLALFLNLFVPLGFWTIVIAHIMFCISFGIFGCVDIPLRLISSL
jgi:spermidine/putrescine transport system permease protein